MKGLVEPGICCFEWRFGGDLSETLRIVSDEHASGVSENVVSVIRCKSLYD